MSRMIIVHSTNHIQGLHISISWVPTKNSTANRVLTPASTLAIIVLTLVLSLSKYETT